MSIASCPFCAFPYPGWGLFCARCGGELQEPSPLECILFQFRTVRTLIRNRVWAGTMERVKVIQKTLADNPSLASPCKKALVWLGQETKDVLNAAVNLPRSLNVAKAVVGILPTNTFPNFRTRVGRLSAFMDALLQAEKEWKSAKAPATKKVRAWFDGLLEMAHLEPDDAHACVYANSHRWPTVATALDPAAYQANRIPDYLAFGVRKHKEKNYGSARKQYEAILAKHPKCIEALEGLARVLVAIDDKPKAIECYREAIRLGTRESASYNNLSWYLCTSARPTDADLEEAVWAARRAVEMAPVASFWDTLAEALERRRNRA